MSKLTLFFLGAPLVKLDGIAVELKLRKAVALLAYVAVTGERHSRDALAELLFPRLGRERGRADLRQIISALHAALGSAAPAADRRGVWVANKPAVDVLEFRRLRGAGLRAAQSGDETAALGFFGQAAGLFRGDFLAGFFLSDSPGFEVWQAAEGEQLRRETVEVLRALVGLRDRREEWAAGIEEARRWLALEPLEEAAHRSLMRLLAISGERGAALRQYERCRELLQKESGQPPGRQTEELRRRIATGAVAGAAAAPGLAETLPWPPQRPGNLPIQPYSFVGRERELAAVLEVLERREVRLLTLTGPGGTGKTRLALEAASRLQERYEHEVFLVDLASLRDPGHVAAAIAVALGVYQETSGERTLSEVLQGYLRGRQVLLVLDNFEHLLPAASEVADLLAACPKVKVLATSREPLRIRAEHELPVPSLGLPPAGEPGAGHLPCESIRLFEQRAAAVLPGFAVSPDNAAAIADICRRLDGLPLAIELVAARVKAFPLPSLLDQLQHGLRLLTDGPRDLPERQRTMRGEIGWSCALLSEGERLLFRRLAVFAGGCTVEAAEAVRPMEAGAEVPAVVEGLAALAAKSLLRPGGEDGFPRFRMLHVIREYAREELEKSGESAETMRLFASYYRELAERAEPFLYGPDQSIWFARLEREYDNIREALAWFRENGAIDDGLRLAGALGWYWFRRARFAEGHSWLELYHAVASPGHSAGARAKVAYHLGLMKQVVGRRYFSNHEAAECYRGSLELWREARDSKGIALSLAGLGCNSRDLFWADFSEETGIHLEESVSSARAAGDPWTISWCLRHAFTAGGRPDLDFATRRAGLEEATRLSRATGDPFLICQAHLGMGMILCESRSHAEAEPWLAEALRIALALDDKWSSFEARQYVACNYFWANRLEEAKRYYREGLRMAMDLGATSFLHWYLGGLDWTARQEGRMKRAAFLRAAAIQWLGGNPAYYGDSRSLTARGLDKDRPTLVIDEATDREQWAAAQSVTIDQVVAYALSDED